MLHTEVVVLEIDVEVREDEAVLDELPNDARHFVAIEFDDGVINLNFGHGAPPGAVAARRPRVMSLVLYLSTLARWRLRWRSS
ncbi:unannotated protein [freshwater metagenome]|uniref:Unannotated protein n=1 Tax=freshwater metagenome TaxID=449393 RepID=A0A6J6XNG1_9ZZZZ